MRLKEFTRIFGPRILERANRRWPGKLCAVYALGLTDPIGRMIAATLHAVGLAPNPFGSVPAGSREPVVAGGVPAAELGNVLAGLISADEHFLLEGEPPLAPGMAPLHAAFEGVAGRGHTAVLVVIAGTHEVFQLDEEATAGAPEPLGTGIFGKVPVVGEA